MNYPSFAPEFCQRRPIDVDDTSSLSGQRNIEAICSTSRLHPYYVATGRGVTHIGPIIPLIWVYL